MQSLSNPATQLESSHSQEDQFDRDLEDSRFVFYLDVKRQREIIPCCHLLDAGTARPRMSNPHVLVFPLDRSEFRLILETITRPGEEPAAQRIDALMNMATRSLKHKPQTR
jgi:hypothetical protein